MKRKNLNLGEYEMTCVDLSFDGKGVAKWQGKPVFIPGFFVNEKALIRLVYERSEFYLGKIVKLLEKSPSRVEPRCKVCTSCGGCCFQQLSYPAQLEFKKHKVEEAFRKIANMNVKVSTCWGMENPYFYRNKVQMPVGLSQKNNIITGFYREKTHEIVPIELCYIQNEDANHILEVIRKLMKEYHILPYDEDRRNGVIRHILIRTSLHKEQIMVVLVTSKDVFGGRGDFVKALHKACPKITTIVQNINSRDTSVILGEKERVLFGKGMIQDAIGGVWFQISAQSFFQVNPLQTEKLYERAIAFADLHGQETVLDAYCGIGTIGLIAAKDAKRVIGVEVIKSAIYDAKRNAKNNGINNIEFFLADASQWMQECTKRHEQIDVVFMDPPRKGADPSFLEALLQLEPKRIVYVSCDPSTLARDIKHLSKKYELSQIETVDMFPMTHHVESVVLLTHKRNK